MDLAVELEDLTDDACAHETHGLPSRTIGNILRDEARRLEGADVPAPPKGTPSKRAVWALTEDGLVRRLRRLTAMAMSPKGGAMTADAVVATLREELSRMCQPV